MAFSPNQKHVLFCRADVAFSTYEIWETKQDAQGFWSAPQHPSFAEQFSNADVHFSADGKRVIFISNRPLTVGGAVRPNHDLWWVELQSNGIWGEAQHVPEPVNLPQVDTWGPSLAGNGSLYFGADRPGTLGGSDIWRSRFVNGVYQAPENLGELINSTGLEVEPWIARDESYMIFSALRRADSLGSYDLYLSRKVNGAFQKPEILKRINTAAREFNHSVSPDEKWLYFTSTRRYSGPLGPRFDHPQAEHNVQGIGDGTTGDIYRIPLRELGIGK